MPCAGVLVGVLGLGGVDGGVGDEPERVDMAPKPVVALLAGEPAGVVGSDEGSTSILLDVPKTHEHERTLQSCDARRSYFFLQDNKF